MLRVLDPTYKSRLASSSSAVVLHPGAPAPAGHVGPAPSGDAGGDSHADVGGHGPAAAGLGAQGEQGDAANADPGVEGLEMMQSAGGPRNVLLLLPDEAESHRLVREHNRSVAFAFLDSPDTFDEIVLNRIYVGYCADLMRHMMKITGAPWEAAQMKRQADGAAREYRLLLAHDGDMFWTLLRNISGGMFNADTWKLVAPTTRMSCQLFRKSARCGAVAYQLLIVRTRWYPYRTFRMHRDPSFANEFHAEPPCCLDAWSLGYRQCYNTVSLLQGEGARAELESDLVEEDVDQYSTERIHSVNLRFRKSR